MLRGRLKKALEKIRGRFLYVAILYSCCYFLFQSLSPAGASELSEVRDIRYWSSGGYTRVVIDLSKPAEYMKRRLSDPDRLYFDLRNTRIPKEIKKKLPVGDGILRAVRAGQYSSDTVRIVLDLETMESFDVFILDDPTRMVIDVNAVHKEERKYQGITKMTVVLDPGHGGHDPGAVGPTGLQEKDVVLDIALRVREILSNEQNIEIIVTRDEDIFLPLEERTAFAMKKDADLFVSIHANASPRRGATGIETYLLNWTNDEEAMRVAARENNISLKRMREMTAKYKSDDYLGIMLSDLRRQNKRDESLKLAHHVQNSLLSHVSKVNSTSVNLGVKQALFYVLRGATMPSVLAEVSFISNPLEERLLSTDSYRAVVARSLASGILNYLSNVSPLQKVAGMNRGNLHRKEKAYQVSLRH